MQLSTLLVWFISLIFCIQPVDTGMWLYTLNFLGNDPVFRSRERSYLVYAESDRVLSNRGIRWQLKSVWKSVIIILKQQIVLSYFFSFSSYSWTSACRTPASAGFFRQNCAAFIASWKLTAPVSRHLCSQRCQQLYGGLPVHLLKLRRGKPVIYHALSFTLDLSQGSYLHSDLVTANRSQLH